MKRVLIVFATLALAAVVFSTSGYSQDKKQDPQPKQPKAPGIPVTWGWQKIGLVADQKKKVQEVIGSYTGKIKDLQEKIDKLKDDEYAEAYKILDDMQKAKVKKPYEKPPVDPAKDDKKKTGG
ncbi:MAG TPA: hypothetical protein VE988_23780 [Gemmataceae bacterium]|nr:hypothetical protein [Gemmataceae bacterium]